jgi:hypothetical protein
MNTEYENAIIVGDSDDEPQEPLIKESNGINKLVIVESPPLIQFQATHERHKTKPCQVNKLA